MNIQKRNKAAEYKEQLEELAVELAGMANNEEEEFYKILFAAKKRTNETEYINDTIAIIKSAINYIAIAADEMEKLTRK